MKPFAWWSLELLKKDPAAFPSEMVVKSFPLFPLLAATAAMMLIYSEDPFEVVSNRKVKGNKKKPNRPLIQKPVTVFALICDSTQLSDWIKQLRNSIGSSVQGNGIYRRSAQLRSGEHLGKNSDYIDIGSLHRQHCKLNEGAGGSGYWKESGLQEKHFVALSVLEHLNALVEALETGDIKSANQEFHNSIRGMLIHSDRLFYENAGWLPPEAADDPLLSVRQQMEGNITESHGIYIPENIQSLKTEIGTVRQLPRNKAARAEAKISERVRAIALRTDLIHFIGGLNRGLFKFQAAYISLTGRIESLAFANKFHDHVSDVAENIIKSLGKVSWTVPSSAAKQIKESVAEELKLRPFELSRKDSAQGKIDRKTIGNDALVEILGRQKFRSYFRRFPK